MAEEPQIITTIRLICEVIYTITMVFFEIFRAAYKLIVPNEPKDVSGEVVLITGTGHGIGREMALRFAKLGATVVCVDVNPQGNQETVDMIKQAKGIAHKYEVDVTDRAAVFKLEEKISKEVGDVTILVNNAGIMPCKPLLRWSEKEIRSTMDINVNGNLWMLQAFLPSMLERNYGHIVGISSAAGLVPTPNLVPYCGSKYAVRGIMDTLAMELHYAQRDTSGIKFTTICPFVVDTGLCHKPKTRFESLVKIVKKEEAADAIVDAVRRELREITIPWDLHYLFRYFVWLIPYNAWLIISRFMGSGVDPHED